MNQGIHTPFFKFKDFPFTTNLHNQCQPTRTGHLLNYSEGFLKNESFQFTLMSQMGKLRHGEVKELGPRK